jgi:glycosyltransferase involved in cell wall biosynthesis
MQAPRHAIIIPACNEAECLGAVLDELHGVGIGAPAIVRVGVNGSRDETAKIARERGVIVAETSARGYGHGCLVAIESALQQYEVETLIFFAADGANDPRDLPALIAGYENGHNLVLGQRTGVAENRRVMPWKHRLANRLLGAWCGVLTGRMFRDLGPLRLIETKLFRRMNLRELTYGWTIEAQIRAVQLGANILEIPVHERPRLAGQQKVSGVSLRQTLRVGAAIFAAGWRTKRRN